MYFYFGLYLCIRSKASNCRNSVSSLCTNCVGARITCPYIELSLLRSTMAVKVQWLVPTFFLSLQWECPYIQCLYIEKTLYRIEGKNMMRSIKAIASRQPLHSRPPGTQTQLYHCRHANMPWRGTTNTLTCDLPFSVHQPWLDSHCKLKKSYTDKERKPR